MSADTVAQNTTSANQEGRSVLDVSQPFIQNSVLVSCPPPAAQSSIDVSGGVVCSSDVHSSSLGSGNDIHE